MMSSTGKQKKKAHMFFCKGRTQQCVKKPLLHLRRLVTCPAMGQQQRGDLNQINLLIQRPFCCIFLASALSAGAQPFAMLQLLLSAEALLELSFWITIQEHTHIPFLPCQFDFSMPSEEKDKVKAKWGKILSPPTWAPRAPFHSACLQSIDKSKTVFAVVTFLLF